MAWISVVLVAQAVLAALLPAARSLAAPVGLATVALGAAGLAFGESTGQSWIAIALGVVVDWQPTWSVPDGDLPTLRPVSMTARPGSCALAVAATGAAVSAAVIIQRAGAWDLGPAPQVTVDIAVGASFSLIALVVLTSPALTPGTRTLARVLQLSGAASAGAALTTALALTATDSTPVSRSSCSCRAGCGCRASSRSSPWCRCSTRTACCPAGDGGSPPGPPWWDVACSRWASPLPGAVRRPRARREARDLRGRRPRVHGAGRAARGRRPCSRDSAPCSCASARRAGSPVGRWGCSLVPAALLLVVTPRAGRHPLTVGRARPGRQPSSCCRSPSASR